VYYQIKSEIYWKSIIIIIIIIIITIILYLYSKPGACLDPSLKGLRHEDFAILGQFCANSSLSASTHTQNAPTKLRGRY